MSPRSRALRRVFALALAPLMLAAAMITPDGAASAEVNTVPQAPATAEVYNPHRGMYSWLEQPSIVPGWKTSDIYWRDQIQWGSQVERTRGQFDFSAFERGMQAAKATNGRFSFRVMAMCPGCGGNLTPSYVPRQANGAPDWNSEAFLSGYERLMNALGARYDKDPRLGIIDVGAYGMWGEWYCDESCGTPMTQANLQRVVRAVSTAFPSKYLVMPIDLEAAQYGASINPKIGLRYDCIGGDFAMTLRYLPDSLRDVWKRAPVVGEWCPMAGSTPQKGIQDVRELHLSMLSSANFATPYDQLDSAGQAAVRTAYVTSGFRYTLTSYDAPGTATAGGSVPVRVTVRNLGVAPTYDSWRTRLHVVNSAGVTVASATLGLDLRRLAEGSATHGSTIWLPRTMPAGKYRLAIAATDNLGYLKPLAFANPGRDGAGRYSLGYVSVTAPAGTTAAKRKPGRRTGTTSRTLHSTR
ncbi:DUF4832 domain-containing protein [Piscicoccus intestinalis]|uniref:DUF4832 domain-containing protein n=1 Tax=Piscicoccus intestinalis TaxID=746033 RepID=UPI0009FED2A4|nr:DUF4832 domain-containing protein [Piscicoccus intestinalis]